MQLGHVSLIFGNRGTAKAGNRPVLVLHVGSCHYGQGTRSLKATSQMDARPQSIGTGDFRSFAIFLKKLVQGHLDSNLIGTSGSKKP